MLLDMATGLIEKLSKEFKEAGPEEKERFIKSSIALLEQFTETMKTNIGR